MMKLKKKHLKNKVFALIKTFFERTVQACKLGKIEEVIR